MDVLCWFAFLLTTSVRNTSRSCGQFLVTFLSDRYDFDLYRSCCPLPISYFALFLWLHNTGKTSKNSGVPVTNFRHRSYCLVSFSTKIRTLLPTIIILITEGSTQFNQYVQCLKHYNPFTSTLLASIIYILCFARHVVLFIKLTFASSPHGTLGLTMAKKKLTVVLKTMLVNGLIRQTHFQYFTCAGATFVSWFDLIYFHIHNTVFWKNLHAYSRTCYIYNVATFQNTLEPPAAWLNQWKLRVQ